MTLKLVYINITKNYPVNAINLTAQIEQVKDKKNNKTANQYSSTVLVTAHKLLNYIKAFQRRKCSADYIKFNQQIFLILAIKDGQTDIIN